MMHRKKVFSHYMTKTVFTCIPWSNSIILMQYPGQKSWSTWPKETKEKCLVHSHFSVIKFQNYWTEILIKNFKKNPYEQGNAIHNKIQENFTWQKEPCISSSSRTLCRNSLIETLASSSSAYSSANSYLKEAHINPYYRKPKLAKSRSTKF